MLEWLNINETQAWWLLIISIIFFIVSLVTVPIILACLPEDYFSTSDRHRTSWAKLHPLIRIPMLVIKNLLGIIFLFAGILMLALPGQGILTIIVGVALMDFPGKYHAERWVISRATVLRAINWIRTRAGKPILIVNYDDNSDHHS